MRDAADHASWWNRELAKLWVQAGPFLGDHAAHTLVADVLGASGAGEDAALLGSVPWLGVPSTLRGRPTTSFRRAPRVALEDGRIAVEIPEGAEMLGDLHLISVPMRVAGFAPATLRVRIGLDADPTATDAGVNLFARGELDIDLPDLVKVLTGLWAIEHGVNWGPLMTTVEAAVFSLVDSGLVEVPSFRRLRYSRRELQPRGVRPNLVHGTYGAEATGASRIDWWDVVFVSDGWGSTARGDFDDIVSEFVARLTSPAPGDTGAAVWRAYSGALRVWTLPLTHGPPAVLAVTDGTDDEAPSAIGNMAQLAEAGLIFDDHLRAEYPDAPPAVGRTTWVIVRPEDARATAYGNMVMLPADSVAGAVATLIHELGHLGFAGLGDEYRKPETRARYRGPEPSQPNLSTSRTPDKWDRFSGLVRPSGGAYDLYRSQIYRPAPNCRMRDAGDTSLGFCPVCKDTIATGLLGHLTAGSGRLQPPLELDVQLTWPFTGERLLLSGAGIGPEGRVPQLPLPYLDVDGDELRVGATVTVRRAAVPLPHYPGVRTIEGPPLGAVRMQVEGTHPNVGFPPGVEATQAADLRFVERLTPEAFGFGAPSDLRQVASGREILVGSEVRAGVDRDTGDYRTDIALSAVSGGRPHDGLRLRTWTELTLTQSGRGPGEARRFAFADPADGPRARHVADLPPLEVGRYRWRADSRLAADADVGSAEDRPGPWRLGSAELARAGADFHFAVLAPEPVDAAPRVPVPLAAGRVQVTVVVNRGGGAADPPAGSWSRFGYFELGLGESAELISSGHVPRTPITPAFLFSGWPAGLEPPDIGAIERFVDRLPPREVVRMRHVVMLARSWSRAFEALRMEFQVSHDGDGWLAVPPSPLALKQRDPWMDADAPGLSAKVVYWEYADDRGADTASLWRCRAIDRSGRTSRWSPPAPLLAFNVESIPPRLGTPI